MAHTNPRYSLLAFLLMLSLVFTAACNTGGTSDAPLSLDTVVVDESLDSDIESESADTSGESNTETSTETSSDNVAADSTNSNDTNTSGKVVLPEWGEEEAAVDAADAALDSPLINFKPMRAIDTVPWASTVAATRTLPLDPPAPGKGHVRGKFTAETPAMRVFMAGEFYMGSVIFSNGQVSLPFVSLQIGVDPKATERTDDGEFVFRNVEPGLYALVIYTPVSQYVVPAEGGLDVLYLEVEAGQVIELNDILIH